MEPDYPAAHSQDTWWFAIDSAGHVGVFCSGENGHVPRDGLENEAFELLEQLDPSSALPESEFLRPEDRAVSLGLYYFDYSDEGFEPIESYTRTVNPSRPKHVDELPPEMRQRGKRICFVKVDFSTNSRVQPLEQFECVFWYDRVAYLDSDGVTVRPIPGQEHKFEEFCARYRQEAPEEASKRRFIGPGQEPDTQSS